MKALLGAAAFGLLPVPSMTSSRRDVSPTGKETGSPQFAALSQSISEKMTVTDKPSGVRHMAPHAPARRVGRMRGVVVILIVALLLIPIIRSCFVHVVFLSPDNALMPIWPPVTRMVGLPLNVRFLRRSTGD
jgi:hypothetical protein